ncbi:TauD/TfdA family dioxygenase [Sphingomonas sp. HMP9]|uniref:TauD/TfdA family dioxygenase n=1 Tax=Sphingomonas sp. HMP9 TaxID=1517554 RepID=UPI001596BD75|nr:TauD/TfdA family dioxygenase [Sphingomonas sp. HMP9]
MTYDIPAAWMAADLADPAEWIIELTPEQIDDIDHAMRQSVAAGLELSDLTKENFPLSSIDRIAPAILDRLENGRGLVVLRGFPALNYDKEQLRRIFWGFGLYVGTAVSQSSTGDLLGDVKNFGADVNSTTGRGYMSKQALGFHTDTADVVALMVLRAARSGGLSLICSSVAIRNEIARTRPDLLEVLYQPFYWSWKGQEAPGQQPYYQQPIYSDHAGKFSARDIKTHIFSAHQDHPELGELSPKQLEAMHLVNSLAQQPRFHFSMMFEPGDIQLLNNHVTYHSRTEFEDFDEPDRKRHLLRMWLSVPNSRDLSPAMSPIYQDQRGGAVRGGFPSRTGEHSFATVAAKD